MTSSVEIFGKIENALDEYESRATDVLVSPREEVSNEKLHENRGRVMAIRDFRKIIRSRLAYDPSQL
jgi:hypothetical protein